MYLEMVGHILGLMEMYANRCNLPPFEKPCGLRVTKWRERVHGFLVGLGSFPGYFSALLFRFFGVNFSPYGSFRTQVGH